MIVFTIHLSIYPIRFYSASHGYNQFKVTKVHIFNYIFIKTWVNVDRWLGFYSWVSSAAVGDQLLTVSAQFVKNGHYSSAWQLRRCSHFPMDGCNQTYKVQGERLAKSPSSLLFLLLLAVSVRAHTLTPWHSSPPVELRMRRCRKCLASSSQSFSGCRSSRSLFCFFPLTHRVFGAPPEYQRAARTVHGAPGWSGWARLSLLQQQRSPVSAFCFCFLRICADVRAWNQAWQAHTGVPRSGAHLLRLIAPGARLKASIKVCHSAIRRRWWHQHVLVKCTIPPTHPPFLNTFRQSLHRCDVFSPQST